MPIVMSCTPPRNRIAKIVDVYPGRL